MCRVYWPYHRTKDRDMEDCWLIFRICWRERKGRLGRRKNLCRIWVWFRIGVTGRMFCWSIFANSEGRKSVLKVCNWKRQHFYYFLLQEWTKFCFAASGPLKAAPRPYLVNFPQKFSDPLGLIFFVENEPNKIFLLNIFPEIFYIIEIAVFGKPKPYLSLLFPGLNYDPVFPYIPRNSTRSPFSFPAKNYLHGNSPSR